MTAAIRTFLYTLFLVLLASCGSDGATNYTGQCSALELTDATAKIAGGTPCGGLEKSPVVLILKNLPDGRTGACSGTMLSPNKALTAAHCLDGASSIDVLFGTTTGRFAYVTSTAWNIHPEYSGFGNGAVRNDVGIVHTPVNLPVPNLPILSSQAPKNGDKVSIFGYGKTETSADIDGKLRVGNMTIAGIDSERLYAYYVAGASDICSGDSGGPMILQVGSQQTIVGTTSYGSSSNCSVGDMSGFMNLQSPSIKNFISRVAPDARYN
jgi:trypsin